MAKHAVFVAFFAVVATLLPTLPVSAIETTQQTPSYIGQKYIKIDGALAASRYPAGYRLLTCQEAKADLQNVMKSLIKWDICAVNGGTVRADRDDSEEKNAASCPEYNPPSVIACQILVQKSSVPTTTYRISRVGAVSKLTTSWRHLTCAEAKLRLRTINTMIRPSETLYLSDGYVKASGRGAVSTQVVCTTVDAAKCQGALVTNKPALSTARGNEDDSTDLTMEVEYLEAAEKVQYNDSAAAFMEEESKAAKDDKKETEKKNPMVTYVAAAVGCVALVAGIAGVVVYRKKKAVKIAAAPVISQQPVQVHVQQKNPAAGMQRQAWNN